MNKGRLAVGLGIMALVLAYGVNEASKLMSRRECSSKSMTNLQDMAWQVAIGASHKANAKSVTRTPVEFVDLGSDDTERASFTFRTMGGANGYLTVSISPWCGTNVVWSKGFVGHI